MGAGPVGQSGKFLEFSELLLLHPHHLQLEDEGDVLVPEKRQDYPSIHGTRAFRSDQLGAWKLRVSICVDKSGFLGGQGSRTLKRC